MRAPTDADLTDEKVRAMIERAQPRAFDDKGLGGPVVRAVHLEKHTTEQVMNRYIVALGEELLRARTKISELNRRCQAAEKAAGDTLEKARRSDGSFGRSLANYAARLYERERDEARFVALQLWRDGWPADGCEPRALTIDQQAEINGRLHAFAKAEREKAE